MTVHTYRPTKDEVAQAYDAMVHKHLRHDHDTGLVWGASGESLMLIHSARMYEMLEVLEGVVSFLPARGLVREIGYRSGFDGSRGMREMFKEEPVKGLLSMARALAMVGGGVCEVKFDDAARQVTVTFPTGTAVGIVAQRRGRRTNPSCAFFEGFAAGWTKGTVDLHVEFEETACRSVSDGECRFESRPLG